MKSKNTRKIRQREQPSGDQRREERNSYRQWILLLGSSAFLFAAKPLFRLQYWIGRSFFRPSIRPARFVVKIDDHQVNEL
jgi:hypothetical protein